MRKVLTVLCAALVTWVALPSLVCALDWNIQTVDGPGNVGWYCSLALDTSNHPHISYLHSAANDYLKYAYNVGAGWNIDTLDQGPSLGCTDIAVDDTGHYYIAYEDVQNADLKLALGRYDQPGGGGSLITVDSVGDVGTYLSIDLDTFGLHGLPHISY
ncbi:hypothetical protein E3J38_00660, partial [candidate division TA06 bacterium]